jgi:hypothetical protein
VWHAPQPQQYVAGCTLVGGGSVGQHLRHSIDHYRRCLDAAHSTHHAQVGVSVCVLAWARVCL